MKVLAVAVFLTVAPAALAKDVTTLVVVGRDGKSRTIPAEIQVVRVFLYHPASVYNVRPHPARPLGGYVRIYPLGPGGLPAEPGRFYPATGALCFSWNQAIVPACGRLRRPPRLLKAARQLAPFHGRATVLRLLDPGGTVNLFAALELAFDRYASSRPARRPTRCVPYVAHWSGPQARRRPSHICLTPRGVWARGRLYPAAGSLASMLGWLVTVRQKNG